MLVHFFQVPVLSNEADETGKERIPSNGVAEPVTGNAKVFSMGQSVYVASMPLAARTQVVGIRLPSLSHLPRDPSGVLELSEVNFDQVAEYLEPLGLLPKI